MQTCLPGSQCSKGYECHSASANLSSFNLTLLCPKDFSKDAVVRQLPLNKTEENNAPKGKLIQLTPLNNPLDKAELKCTENTLFH